MYCAGTSEDVDSCEKAVDEGFQAVDAGPSGRHKWRPAGQQHTAMECCDLWVWCRTVPFPFINLDCSVTSSLYILISFTALTILHGMEVSLYNFRYRLNIYAPSFCVTCFLLPQQCAEVFSFTTSRKSCITLLMGLCLLHSLTPLTDMMFYC